MDEKRRIIERTRKTICLPKLEKEIWCDFRVDYEFGMTLKAIAEKYFCDPRTVHRCIIENVSSDEIGKQRKPTKLAPYYQQVESLYHQYVNSVSPAFPVCQNRCQ